VHKPLLDTLAPLPDDETLITDFFSVLMPGQPNSKTDHADRASVARFWTCLPGIASSTGPHRRGLLPLASYAFVELVRAGDPASPLLQLRLDPPMNGRRGRPDLTYGRPGAPRRDGRRRHADCCVHCRVPKLRRQVKPLCSTNLSMHTAHAQAFGGPRSISAHTAARLPSAAHASSASESISAHTTAGRPAATVHTCAVRRLSAAHTRASRPPINHGSRHHPLSGPPTRERMSFSAQSITGSHHGPVAVCRTRALR
jgi:hypothetical protein